MYAWYIDGSKIKDFKEIDTKVLFESDYKEKINELTNYSNMINLKFSNKNALPENTTLKVYVGKTFDKVSKIYTYQ